jgi:GNAT superfamily N-acetyltransferase
MIAIRRLTQPTLNDLQPLIDASAAEGYTFVQRLWDEYQSGENTFADGGAELLGAYENDQLIAVGGVHPDPYLGLSTVGRIRHVYVLPGYRRSGIGKQLVRTLIADTSKHFMTFTLRTTTEHGRAFYSALGFSDEPRFADATHWLESQPQQKGRLSEPPPS